jgi:hypothetical protein
MFTPEQVLVMEAAGATKYTNHHYQLSTARGRCTGNLHKRRDGTFFIVLGVPGGSTRHGEYIQFENAWAHLKHLLAGATSRGY